jgi:hypothetical protein
MVLKIALAIFFLRITVHKWQKYTIHAALILSTVFSVAFFFFALFQCGPLKDATKFVAMKTSGQCLSKSLVMIMSYVHAGIVSITDLLFALLPILLLKDANMVKREKVVVGIILSIGTV